MSDRWTVSVLLTIVSGTPRASVTHPCSSRFSTIACAGRSGHTRAMPAYEDSASIAALQAGIDAVLVPRGFAPGKGGTDDEQGQIIWCAAAGGLATRFPTLPTSHEPADGWSTMCTDLVVGLAVTDGAWRITSVSLEGHDLGQALADLGRTDAAQRAAALLGSTAREGLASLPALLTALMDGPTSKP